LILVSFLNERGQLEKMGLLIIILVVGVVISIIFRKYGDPFNLSFLIWIVIAVLLIGISISK